MINRAPPDFLTPDMADFSVRVADWFEKLRDNICGQFETIESDAEDSPLSNQPSGHFSVKTGHVTAVAVAKYRSCMGAFLKRLGSIFQWCMASLQKILEPKSRRN